MSGNTYTNEYRLFLQLLRESRQKAGLTQRDVAERLGRSQSFVEKIENGHNRLDVGQMVQFLRVLNVPLLKFMKAYDQVLRDSAKREDIDI